MKLAIALAAALAVGAVQAQEQKKPAKKAAKADMTFFVTSVGKASAADLGGVEGADAHCNSLAKAVGSKHEFHAYLSTWLPGGDAGVNARDRIGKGPWRNAKGVEVAKNVADLHSGKNKITK